jgi:tetratricopeptide (TPR) repeat protein
MSQEHGNDFPNPRLHADFIDSVGDLAQEEEKSDGDFVKISAEITQPADRFVPAEEIRRGREFVAQGKLQEAESLLKYVVSCDPKNAEARLEYARCLLALKAYKECMGALASGLSHARGGAFDETLVSEMFFLLAECRLMTDDRDRALKSLQDAVATNPCNDAAREMEIVMLMFGTEKDAQKRCKAAMDAYNAHVKKVLGQRGKSEISEAMLGRISFMNIFTVHLSGLSQRDVKEHLERLQTALDMGAQSHRAFPKKDVLTLLKVWNGDFLEIDTRNEINVEAPESLFAGGNTLARALIGYKGFHALKLQGMISLLREDWNDAYKFLGDATTIFPRYLDGTNECGQIRCALRILWVHKNLHKLSPCRSPCAADNQGTENIDVPKHGLTRWLWALCGGRTRLSHLWDGTLCQVKVDSRLFFALENVTAAMMETLQKVERKESYPATNNFRALFYAEVLMQAVENGNTGDVAVLVQKYGAAPTHALFRGVCQPVAIAITRCDIEMLSILMKSTHPTQCPCLTAEKDNITRPLPVLSFACCKEAAPEPLLEVMCAIAYKGPLQSIHAVPDGVSCFLILLLKNNRDRLLCMLAKRAVATQPRAFVNYTSYDEVAKKAYLQALHERLLRRDYRNPVPRPADFTGLNAFFSGCRVY